MLHSDLWCLKLKTDKVHSNTCKILFDVVNDNVIANELLKQQKYIKKTS